MGEFRMPSLGSEMEEGVLERWYVKPGDRIRRGELIAAVHTDKGAIDVEVFEDGVVARLVGVPGERYPVGALLAELAPIEGATGAVPVVEAAAAPPEPPGRVRVSPRARRLAAQLGVDLAAVPGTGPGGAIQEQDIHRVAEARAAAPAGEAPPPAGVTALGAMRAAVAASVARSNREIPHYHLQTSLDLGPTLAWLERENRERPLRARILLAAPLLWGVIRGLEEVPELNGFWVEDRLQVKEEIELGFAVALRDGGLVTPALAGARSLSLEQLAEALRDVVERARRGRLTASELARGTVTVTHMGELGVESVFGLIHPPQVALVGLGSVVDRPWAEGGMVGVRPVMRITLSGDHRATDGRHGARFLKAFAEALARLPAAGSPS